MEQRQMYDAIGVPVKEGDYIAIAVSTSTRNAEQLVALVTGVEYMPKSVKVMYKAVFKTWYWKKEGYLQSASKFIVLKGYEPPTIVWEEEGEE
ncbi:MAG: hypothetical protein J6Y37_09250 [Paludibacteraceae bacterium]|nr:hypothetical protein [Paludibacteraceae bacterium]